MREQWLMPDSRREEMRERFATLRELVFWVFCMSPLALLMLGFYLIGAGI